MLSACGGGEKQAPTAGKPVTGEFVGKVDGRDDFLVAVVAQGQGASRTVRVYVCSEKDKVAEWFPATATRSNAVQLKSERAGARAAVRLTAAGAEGNLTLADGKRLDFSAAPARGIGGLYDVTVSPGGKLSGKDPVSGATTRGQVSTRPTGTRPFVYPVRQSYTAPDGVSVQVKSGAADLTTGKARCIVVDSDGKPRTSDALGIGKGVRTTSGFKCPILEF